MPGDINQDVVDLTDESPAILPELVSDSDDEDLKAAIALSLQDVPVSKPIPTTVDQSPQAQLSYGIAGINRKQQEEERLARLKRKRQGTISPPPTKRVANLPPSSTITSEAATPVTISDGENAPNKIEPLPSLPYENGVVLKTWAFGFPRKRDVKIEEILQKNTLQAAVFSSFQWDMEWLFSKVNTAKTKFVLIMQAKDQITRDQYRRETSAMPNLRLCFPPMEGQINCMHSKLMLLFYPEQLRIVVPTANLVPFDWGEQGGFMENSVFAIDLPRLKRNGDKGSTPFKDQILVFLKAQTIQQDVLDKLEQFDFGKTKNYAFVHTIGGSHRDPVLKTTGICGLARAVNELCLKSDGLVQVDYITSSVGSLKTDFLAAFYSAALGEDGLALYRDGKPPAKRATPTTTDARWNQRFRCYFPSQETVELSKSGPSGAGTVCFQEDWWNNPTFPRDIMRDCVSTRGGMLMHNKIMYVRPLSGSMLAQRNGFQGFSYVGSANLSESAWGKVVYDRGFKGPKLNCRNWECGVLVPFRSPSNTSTLPLGDTPEDFRALDKFVPVPIALPARPLAPIKPWFFMNR